MSESLRVVKQSNLCNIIETLKSEKYSRDCNRRLFLHFPFPIFLVFAFSHFCIFVLRSLTHSFAQLLLHFDCSFARSLSSLFVRRRSSFASEQFSVAISVVGRQRTTRPSVPGAAQQFERARIKTNTHLRPPTPKP